jgi:hypothetical protein
LSINSMWFPIRALLAQRWHDTSCKHLLKLQFKKMSHRKSTQSHWKTLSFNRDSLERFFCWKFKKERHIWSCYFILGVTERGGLNSVQYLWNKKFWRNWMGSREIQWPSIEFCGRFNAHRVFHSSQKRQKITKPGSSLNVPLKCIIEKFSLPFYRFPMPLEPGWPVRL